MVSPNGKKPPTLLVSREAELRDVVARFAHAKRIAVDIESNGLFKYKATVCTMQLATNDEVVVVDALATSLAPLAGVLGPTGPRKIVHDVAFDARILAEANLELGNVFDTSIAARMLGKSATGLASLLASELGIAMDKKLQHHDWTERPLLRQHFEYLAGDVLHLEQLADVLATSVEGRGIGDAVEEETRYRLEQAGAAARSVDPRPAYVRLKGIDRAPKADWPILRRLAEVRELKAKSLDVPPYKVIGPDVLFAIARAKPRTMEELARIKGATNGHRARSIGRAMLDAVAAGIADAGALPNEERAMLERPRLPAALIKARRARESRLTSWRKAEARKRGVDEQVVLPGHCLQDIAGLEAVTLEHLAAIPGMGAFRVERDGQAILAAIAQGAEDSDVAATAEAIADVQPTSSLEVGFRDDGQKPLDREARPKPEAT